MEHKKLIIVYYHSNLIEEMLFSSEEDAENFDNLLSDYIKNPQAIKEFKSVKFASLEAIRYNIEHDMFVEHLEGEYSDRLVEACERMVSGYNGACEDDCYRLTFNYILNHIYGDKLSK